MFELTAETPLTPVNKRTLVIAITARTGSTNLCSALAKLRTFGTPREVFNQRRAMQRFDAELGGCASADDYISRLASEGEIFAFKAAWLDWPPFAVRARQVFPQASYVYLHRLDLDAQAISLFRAKATDRWHLLANGADAAPADVEFDAEQIVRCRQQIVREDEAWRRFFFRNELKPLHIAYEHLADDLPRALRMICAEVGIDLPYDQAPSGDLRITRDEITNEWKRRLSAAGSQQ